MVDGLRIALYRGTERASLRPLTEHPRRRWGRCSFRGAVHLAHDVGADLSWTRGRFERRCDLEKIELITNAFKKKAFIFLVARRTCASAF